jgi:Fe-S-cluster containining protein
MRPTLRASVLRIEHPTGEVELVDGPGGASVVVPPELVALVGQLTGHLTADEALAVTSAPPEASRALLKSLALTGFLLGCDEPGRARRVEARATDAELNGLSLPFSLLVESRFVCGRCGECCRQGGLGPVSAEERERLRAADFVTRDPDLDPDGLFVLVSEQTTPRSLAGPRWHLAAGADGACVFLEADGGCRVQRELGEDAKPLVCRLFPWRVLPTPDGLVVADSTACATYSQSSVAGPALHEAFDAVRPVLREAARRLPLVAGVAGLPGGLHVPRTHLARAVSKAIEALDATPPGWALGLATVGNTLSRYLRVLAEPLRADLGERALEALEATPLPDLVAAAPRDLGQGGHAAARALAEACPEDSFLAGACAAYAGGHLDDAAAWEPDLEQHLRRAVRQRLHGLDWEASGSLGSGLLEVALAGELTRAGARLEATRRGASRATASDYDRAQVACLRSLSQAPARAVLRAESARGEHLLA